MDPGLLDWLCDPACPPVRYQALRDLAPEPPSARELERLHAEALAWPPLQRLLSTQQDDGGFPWAWKQQTAMPTFVALDVMARCGLDAGDEPVARALDWVLQEHGRRGPPSYLKGASGILPCYVGKVGRAIFRLAGPDAPLVREAIEWVVAHQRFDHRERRAGGDVPWPIKSPGNTGCWDSISCYHGVVGALGVLATVLAEVRSDSVQARVDQALDYLRRVRGYRRSNGKPITRFLTKLYIVGDYRSHVLEVLEVLADLDPTLSGEDWVADMAAWVESRAVEGRLPQDTEYGKKLAEPLGLEEVGAPSRFLTLQWERTKRRFSAP